MRGTSEHRLIVATAAAVLPSAGAVAPPEPSAAGVLVTVADRPMDLDEYGAEAQKLTSYWVDTPASPAATPVEIAGLVIPTPEGFRRLLVRRRSTQIPGGLPNLAEMDTQQLEETIVEWPLASIATPPEAPPWKDERGPPCSFSRLFVTFASPAVISLEAHSGNSEACEPRGFHWSEAAWVQRLDDPAKVSFSSLLGRAAGDAYADAGRTAFRSSRSRQDPESQDACSPPVPEEDTGWCVRRSEGRWTPVLKQQLGSAFCVVDAPIRITLPPPVVGFREPTRPLAATRRDFPNATDAHMSPDGKWMVATMPDRIVVASVQGDTVAALPPGVVILVQWAPAEDVSEWRKALTR